LAGSLLDLRITMPDSDLEVDLLPPPSQPVKEVPVERSKWRDIDDLDSWSSIRFTQEAGEDWENCRLGLPTCRGGDQQDVLAFQNRRNRLFLGFGGFEESSFFDSFR